MSNLITYLKKKCCWLTVEPMILVYWGAYNMTCTIKQDFFLSIVCQNLYPESDTCLQDYNDTIKRHVESKVILFLLFLYHKEINFTIIFNQDDN